MYNNEFTPFGGGGGTEVSRLPVSIYVNKHFCNNCGKSGHVYHNCNLPIISNGIIAFRINNKVVEYLMICRRDTLGFIDFMRGKYSIYNSDYIMNMIKQMTEDEKLKLKSQTFEELWCGIWGNKKISSQYNSEEIVSKNKFKSLSSGVYSKNEFYTLESLIEDSYKYDSWKEPEWGFPKGRRNYKENDYDCAVREFIEETGFSRENIITMQNILPFEEIFTGSNYKSYKHRYFLSYFYPNEDTINKKSIDNYEVSKVEWKTYEECMKSIRHYNLEKKRLITNVNTMLKLYKYIIY